MKISRVLLAALPLALFASITTAQDRARLIPVEVDSDVVYGHKTGMALTFDVLKPAKANGAGVLFMVSGGWNSRWSPPEEAAQRFPPLDDLLQNGFTVFAVRHGSGGSAGGHLSLMLGTTGDDGDAAAQDPVDRGSSRVAAVVAYFPPVDLTSIVGPHDRFPALDFDPSLAQSVSPIFFVSSDDVPSLMIHGDKDERVPLRNSARILEAFKGAGVTTDLIVLPGAKHGFVGEQAVTANQAMVRWFQTYLAPGQGGEPTQATAR